MCVACQSPVSPEQVDQFTARFIGDLNAAASMLLVSVGHRAGLFDALHRHPGATSEVLAEAAERNERYVREWLGGVVAAGIVEVDDAGRHYTLPAAHAASLAPAAGGELAYLAQYIGFLGGVEDDIVGCFERGGGVPYERFPRFHEVMMQESAVTVVAALDEHLLPLIPGGIERLERGISVLDVGCGRGRALQYLAGRFPRSTFVGYDLNGDAIGWAREQTAAAGLTNLTFEQRDLSDFDLTADEGAFDLVTAFDAIHDQARPDKLLAGIRRTLRKGGHLLMQDIGASSNVAENRDHPLGPMLYTISCMHCMTVSLAQGGLGVGAMWGEQMTKEFLAQAGFRSVERHTLAHDIQNFYYVVEA